LTEESEMIKMRILTVLLLLNVEVIANDVVVTVSGRVVPLPCTVDTTQLNLDLGQIYVSMLAQPGSAGAWVNSIIRLSNCPAVTTGITASFTGQQGTSYYKNNGTARSVEIQLQSTAGADLSNGKSLQLPITAQGTSELPIRVRAYSVGGKATDGTIQGTINVTYTYQ